MLLLLGWVFVTVLLRSNVFTMPISERRFNLNCAHLPRIDFCHCLYLYENLRCSLCRGIVLERVVGGAH